VKGKNYVLNNVSAKKTYNVSNIDEVLEDVPIDIQKMGGLNIIVDNIIQEIEKIAYF
jgi:hypothetical protein